MIRRSSRRKASGALTTSEDGGSRDTKKRLRRSSPLRDAVDVKVEQNHDEEQTTSARATYDVSDSDPVVSKSEDQTATQDNAEEIPAGPSEYELARLENIKRNAMVMASLGLSGGTVDMRKTVDAEAAQRARARGLKGSSRKVAKPRLERTRQSARVRGKTPEGKPLDDPEEAFLRQKQGDKGDPSSGPWRPSASRISGDVSMSSSNASADGTLRLREMMGGLVGRYVVEGGDEAFELAKPDEALKRLRGLKVGESGVCKAVTQRAYSAAWHPTTSKLLLAVGDKIGNIGVWVVDKSVEEGEGGDDDDGVYEFRPHSATVARVAFDPLDGNKLLSTSYDGTVRRMDVEKGAFEQVYANDPSDGAILTYSHLMEEERTLLLSDDGGDVTAVDLRTNKQVWKREAHEKKANTVHGHPISRHIFATASLDRSVKTWDARSLGKGPGGMRPLVTMPHFKSVNSAHFSPRGEWLVTVGQDDKLKLFRDLADASGPEATPAHVLPHNNQTGRWLTKFQASWDPKAQAVFAIGSMQKAPHGVHLYSLSPDAKKPSAVTLEGGEIMSSIQSVVVFHPQRDVIAGLNSSGRAHVFM